MIPITSSGAYNWDKIPSVQSGRGIVGYRGSTRYQRQRGAGIGSMFRSFFKLARPALSKVAKTVAKEGLESAALIGSDLIEGDDLKSSVKKRSVRGVKKLLKKALLPEVRGYTRLGKPRKSDLRGKFGKRKKQTGSGVRKVGKKKRKRQVGYGKKKVYKRSSAKKSKPGKRKSDYLGLIY